MWTRPLIYMAALLFVFFGGAGPSVASVAETVTVGAVGSASAALWPVEIGLARGFFTDEGVAVDLVFARSNAAVMQQLAAGSLDVSITSGLVDPIRAINQHARIAIVRIEGQVPSYALLARPTFKRFRDLEGKTISVGGAKDITRTHLERTGKASTTQLGNVANALQAMGDLDPRSWSIACSWRVSPKRNEIHDA